ncbi:hypothetical protein Nmel_013108 [Mimus melanotis]
MTGGAGPAAP